MIYRFHKKIKCFFHCSILSLLLINFISCSKTANSEDIFYLDNKDTIRYEANNKIESSSWSEEIHKSRLLENSSKNSKAELFFQNVNLSQNLNIQIENKALYPELENFGSLNLTSLDFNTQSAISKLINKIKEENITKTDFLLGFQQEKILLDYEFSKHSKINSYYLGTPTENTNIKISIPVQFLFEDGKLNTTFHLEKAGKDYKIKQVVFGEFLSDK
jgi:hypothetical protein